MGKNIHLVLSLSAALLLSACSKNSDPRMGDANISVSLSADGSSNEVSISSKSSGSISPEDFMFHIENAPLPGNAPDVVYGPVRFSEVPSVLRYTAGAYKLVAIHGGGVPMPAFDSPIYRAEQKITIASGEHRSVEMLATLSTTKMSVTFDETFPLTYADYSVDIRTIEDEYLTFSSTEARAGYFTPGHIRMRFNLTTKEGKQVTYSPEGHITVTPTKAKEYYKLKLSVRPGNNGNGKINIITDETTEDKTISIEIPAYMLPKAPPLVTPTGFESGVPVSTHEGLFTKHNVSLLSTAGVKSVKLKTTAPATLAAGWPAEGIDLVGLDQAGRAMLRGLGLKWSDELNSPDQAANLTKATYVDFGGITGHLTTTANTTTDQDFTVEVIDLFGQSSGVYTLRLSVAPPIFSLGATSPGNVWATRAEFTTTYTTENGAKPTVQYKPEGEGWITPTVPNLEIIDDNPEAGTLTYRIKGLTVDKLYSFRAVMGAHYTEPFTQTTESPNQVPNSDMEEWNMWKYKKGLGYEIPFYEPWNSGASVKTWATNNPRTISYTVLSNQYNCAPAVSYTYTCHSGTKAAEIRTVSGSGSAVNSAGVGDNNGNRTRGRLFIGDYSYPGGNGDNINYGRPFDTRPLGFTFYYQFMPYSTDEFEAYIEVKNGTTTIATGTYRSSSESREWAKAEVSLNYQRSDLKATSISISFVSTTASQPLVQLNRSINYADMNNGSWYAHYGSVLRIDDLNLTY